MTHLAVLVFALIMMSLYCYIAYGHPLKRFKWPFVYIFTIFEGMYFIMWVLTNDAKL